MKIGYVRVSKHEQNEALQIDALKETGCEKWFVDKITGSKAERKGLSEALAYLRPGDTFVVWKLDLAGRSLPHLIELLKDLQGRGIEFLSLTEQIDTTTPGGKLIFHLMGALAEFERDLIRERTNAGLAAARVRGHVGGRPRKLKTNGKVALARRMFADQSHSIPEICATLGSLALLCIGTSKRPNRPRNYRKSAHRIPKFTPVTQHNRASLRGRVTDGA